MADEPAELGAGVMDRLPVLVGYVLLFVMPAIVLGLLFPAYIGEIVLVAFVLFLCVTGFVVGRAWDSSAWTDENRDAARQAVQNILHVEAVGSTSAGAGKRLRRAAVAVVGLLIGSFVMALWLRKSYWETLRDDIIPPVAVLLPFLFAFQVGRALRRRQMRP